VTLRKIHASGLGSVGGDVLRAQVLRWINEHHPDRITHTEMGRDNRSRALAGIEGYGLAHVNGPDGQDECALQYRLDGPHPTRVRAVRLSGLPIPRRGGKFCFALHTEFEDGSHEIVGHMPSGVQGNGRINDTEQGRVYLDAIDGLQRLVASLDGRVSMPFDWNLDLELPWVREYFALHFPDFTLPRIPADGGTHGHRWIDFTIARGYTTTAVELPTPAAVSDHDAVLETLKEIPAVNRDAVIDQLLAAGVECYNRTQWGSPRERDGSYARRRATHPMPPGPASYHFLHITVTDDTDLPADGKEAAQKVETFGFSTPPMVSYQDLVTNEGRYFQGQDYGTKGTHTVNDKRVPGFPFDLNLHGYAVAIMQNVGDRVTDVQVDVIAMIFAARELAGLVKRGAPIYPHRKFANKLCPGDRAVARLDEIEALRTKYVREGLPTEGEFDMTVEELQQAILNTPVPVIGADGKQTTWKLSTVLRNVEADQDRQTGRLKAIEAKIDTLLAKEGS
jgi:hypothetical protein